MSDALFVLERRFELRALYMLTACLWGLAISALWFHDWWLLIIAIMASLFNGHIGASLHKNRQKSFGQLTGASEGLREFEGSTSDLNSGDLIIVKKSARKFIILCVITSFVVAFHFQLTLLAVTISTLAVWIFSLIVTDSGITNLQPGMAVTADIKTGRRKIISYLLSPFARQIGEVGHER
jgi:hypothetical protein